MSETILRNETLHSIRLQDIPNQITSDVTVDTLPRAAVSAQLHIGKIDPHNIPVKFIVYGGPRNLEQPQEGVYRIVSQLTYLAAFREGRPVDDLLVPHCFDPDSRVAKGLAIPDPIPNKVPLLSTNKELLFENIDSACAFPVKVFDAQTPSFVDSDHAAIKTIRPLAAPLMSICYEQEEYEEGLSEKLGVPIYRPSGPVVSYNPELFETGSLTVVEHRMFMAGFPLYDKNTISAGLLDQDVRVASGAESGSVLGGRSIVVPLQLPYRI